MQSLETVEKMMGRNARTDHENRLAALARAISDYRDIVNRNESSAREGDADRLQEILKTLGLSFRDFQHDAQTLHRVREIKREAEPLTVEHVRLEGIYRGKRRELDNALKSDPANKRKWLPIEAEMLISSDAADDCMRHIREIERRADEEYRNAPRLFSDRNLAGSSGKGRG